MPKKTSKAKAARASKSAIKFVCKECKACEKEDLYWCEVEGAVLILR